jgi:hypothetical protein
MNGKDIPHLLILNSGKSTKYVAAYRFYSDNTEAETALAKIKKSEKGAKIITVNKERKIIG